MSQSEGEHVQGLLRAIFALSSSSFSLPNSLLFESGQAKALWMGSGPKAVGKISSRDVLSMFKRPSSEENTHIALLHRVVRESIVVTEALTNEQLVKQFSDEDVFAELGECAMLQRYDADGRPFRVTMTRNGSPAMVFLQIEGGKMVEGEAVGDAVHRDRAMETAKACADAIAGSSPAWESAVVDLIESGDRTMVLLCRGCALLPSEEGGAGAEKAVKSTLPRVGSARNLSDSRPSSSRDRKTTPRGASKEEEKERDTMLPPVTPRSARVNGGADSLEGKASATATPRSARAKESAGASTSGHLPSVSPRQSVTSVDTNALSPKVKGNASTAQSSQNHSEMQTPRDLVDETDKKESKEVLKGHAEKLKRKLYSLPRAILTAPVLAEPEDIFERPRVFHDEEDPFLDVLRHVNVEERDCERSHLRDSEKRSSDGKSIEEELGRSDEDHREESRFARVHQVANSYDLERIGEEAAGPNDSSVGDNGKEPVVGKAKSLLMLSSNAAAAASHYDDCQPSVKSDVDREVLGEIEQLVSSYSAFRSGLDLSKLAWKGGFATAEEGGFDDLHYAAVEGQCLFTVPQRFVDDEEIDLVPLVDAEMGLGTAQSTTLPEYGRHSAIEETLVAAPSPSMPARTRTAGVANDVCTDEHLRVVGDKIGRRADKVKMRRQTQSSNGTESGRSDRSTGAEMGLRSDRVLRAESKSFSPLVPDVTGYLMAAVSVDDADVHMGGEELRLEDPKRADQRTKAPSLLVSMLRSLAESRPLTFEGTTVLKKARPSESEQGGLLKLAVTRGMGKRVAQSETKAFPVAGILATGRDLSPKDDEESEDQTDPGLSDRRPVARRYGEVSLEDTVEFHRFVSGLGLKTTRVAEVVAAEYNDVDLLEARLKNSALVSKPNTAGEEAQFSSAVAGWEGAPTGFERVAVEDDNAGWMAEEGQLDRLSAEASRGSGPVAEEMKKANRLSALELERSRDVLAGLGDVDLRHKTEAAGYRLGSGATAVLEPFLSSSGLNEGGDEPRLRLLEELAERLVVDIRAAPAAADAGLTKSLKRARQNVVSSSTGGVAAGSFRAALEKGFGAGINSRFLEVEGFEPGVSIRLQKKKGEESDKIREAAAPRVLGLTDEDDEEEADIHENPLVNLHAKKAAYDVRDEIEVMKQMNAIDKGDFNGLAEDTRPATAASVAQIDGKASWASDNGLASEENLVTVSAAAPLKNDVGQNEEQRRAARAAKKQRLAALEKAKALALAKGSGRRDIVTRIQAIETALQQLYSKLDVDDMDELQPTEEKNCSEEVLVKGKKLPDSSEAEAEQEDTESVPMPTKPHNRRGSVQPAEPSHVSPRRLNSKFSDAPSAFEKDMQEARYEELIQKSGKTSRHAVEEPPPAAFNERLLAIERRRQQQRQMEEESKGSETLNSRELEELEYGRRQAEAFNQPRLPVQPTSAWGGDDDQGRDEEDELRKIEEEERELERRREELEGVRNQRATNSRRTFTPAERRMVELHGRGESDPYDPSNDETVGATPRVGASPAERSAAGQKARALAVGGQSEQSRRQRNVVEKGSLRRPSPLKQPQARAQFSNTAPHTVASRPVARTPDLGARFNDAEADMLSMTAPPRPRGGMQQPRARARDPVYGEVPEGEITASDFDTDDGEGMSPSPVPGGKLPLPSLDIDSVPLELRLDDGMVSPDTSIASMGSRRSGFSKDSRRMDDGDSTARSDYSDVDSVAGITSEFRSIFSKVRHGKKSDVVDFIDRGCPVDTRDKHGNSLLIIAAQNGHKRVVKALLRRGANLNCQNHRGQTALHFCYAYGYQELGDYLVSKGADDTIINNYGLTCYEGLQP